MGRTDTIEDLTAELADRISSDFQPLVSGYTATFATDWPAIQCSAAIDGLKVGSGMGTGLAGVAKVSIRVPAKYGDRQATDFVIECSRY